MDGDHMTTRRKTVYLANAYGFSAQQRATVLPDLVAALESLGLEVWEPFQRNNQTAGLEPGWAYHVGQADVRDVQEADAIFAVVNGVPPDEGVMVELGIAIAQVSRRFFSETTFGAPQTPSTIHSTSCSSPACPSTVGNATTSPPLKRLPPRRRCWPTGLPERKRPGKGAGREAHKQGPHSYHCPGLSLFGGSLGQNSE